MVKIAIIYHSETGNTERMAGMVEQGCRSVPEVEVKVMSHDRVDTAFLEQAGAVILGCPNYEGSCSWQMKRFLDSPQPAGLLAGKLGGVFVTQNWPGGGGGSFAEMTMIHRSISAQWPARHPRASTGNGRSNWAGTSRPKRWSSGVRLTKKTAGL